MPRPSRSVGRLAPLLLGLLITLAFAAPAHGYVYWTNFKADTIGRAMLDGSAVEQSFIGPPDPPINPCAIDIDGEYVYWANQAGSAPQGKIGRAKLDGSEVDNEFITGANNPCGVAVDASYVYWGHTGVGATTIGRARLDGTEVDQSFISGLDRPRGIAVDGGHIYWAEAVTTIGRANLSGTGVDTAFIAPFSVVDVAVTGTHIYWAPSTTRIGRANLDGSGKDEFFLTGGTSIGAVDANRSHIYWGDEGDDTIGRANLDGSAVVHGLISGADGPEGVAVTELPPPVPIVDPGPITKPTGSLRLLKVVRNRKRGTAKLIVAVSGPGPLRLAGNKKVKGATRNAKAAGRVKLPLVPKRKAKVQLLEVGRIKVLAKVTFTPTGGEPVIRSWRRPLIRQLAPR
jgi:virginiamycin B lyase